VSYELEIPSAAPPDVRALQAALAVPDLHGFPDDDGPAWPDRALLLYREGLSTRHTEVSWRGEEEGKPERLVVSVPPLASAEDCDLALRVVEAAAALAGAPEIHTDYFGTIAPAELRRWHAADWMNEQAASGTEALVTLIKDGKGPIPVPGPRRPCWIGDRLLAELEAAGPGDALPSRVLATLRRVQWEVPAGFREAAVFASGPRERETDFAVWLPDEDLIIPCVDYVALRARTGEVVMVPFAAVATLAGPHARPLDECQLLVTATTPEVWAEIVARARPLAARAGER
jgi:hypothetical protein